MVLVVVHADVGIANFRWLSLRTLFTATMMYNWIILLRVVCHK
uniref:Uncharacterized protein n=1 Tax=Arundo donax TaxID=35708 RepID=A0A0A9DF53_ARUDO